VEKQGILFPFNLQEFPLVYFVISDA